MQCTLTLLCFQVLYAQAQKGLWGIAVILGPIQAATYILNYGLVSMAMGTLWAMHKSWWLIIATCALVRVLGQVGMLALSSWAMNENLFILILHSLHGLLVGDCTLRAAQQLLQAAMLWHACPNICEDYMAESSMPSRLHFAGDCLTYVGRAHCE